LLSVRGENFSPRAWVEIPLSPLPTPTPMVHGRWRGVALAARRLRGESNCRRLEDLGEGDGEERERGERLEWEGEDRPKREGRGEDSKDPLTTASLLIGGGTGSVSAGSSGGGGGGGGGIGSVRDAGVGGARTAGELRPNADPNARSSSSSSSSPRDSSVALAAAAMYAASEAACDAAVAAAAAAAVAVAVAAVAAVAAAVAAVATA
jgi:hypothetical protein